MADEKNTPQNKPAPVAATPAAESIEQPQVAAPKNALIGDENIGDARKVEVEVNKDSVSAQVTGPAAEVVAQVPVHETSVTMDRVITDPSSPEAVQIPDAGRGSLDLPIHALNAPTVEEFFDKHR